MSELNSEYKTLKELRKEYDDGKITVDEWQNIMNTKDYSDNELKIMIFDSEVRAKIILEHMGSFCYLQSPWEAWLCRKYGKEGAENYINKIKDEYKDEINKYFERDKHFTFPPHLFGYIYVPENMKDTPEGKIYMEQNT